MSLPNNMNYKNRLRNLELSLRLQELVDSLMGSYRGRRHLGDAIDDVYYLTRCHSRWQI